MINSEQKSTRNLPTKIVMGNCDLKNHIILILINEIKRIPEFDKKKIDIDKI